MESDTCYYCKANPCYCYFHVKCDCGFSKTIDTKSEAEDIKKMHQHFSGHKTISVSHFR